MKKIIAVVVIISGIGIVYFFASGFGAAYDLQFQLVPNARANLDRETLRFFISLLIFVFFFGWYDILRRKEEAKKKISDREEARAAREKEIYWF